MTLCFVGTRALVSLQRIISFRAKRKTSSRRSSNFVCSGAPIVAFFPRRILRRSETAATKRKLNSELHSPTRDPEVVREMFGRVAQRYDLANHVLSLGVDFFWRACAARLVPSWKAERILDLATGSGDLALAMERRLPHAKIVAADFSPRMIQIARSKGVRETIVADALQLPFATDRSIASRSHSVCATSPTGVRHLVKCLVFSQPAATLWS